MLAKFLFLKLFKLKSKYPLHICLLKIIYSVTDKTLAFNPSFYGISLKFVCFQQPKPVACITEFSSVYKLSAETSLVEDSNHALMTKLSDLEHNFGSASIFLCVTLDKSLYCSLNFSFLRGDIHKNNCKLLRGNPFV